MTQTVPSGHAHRLSSFTPYLVQAEDLLRRPSENRLFIECRLGTDLADERQAYREQHIHGAVYAQIREVFARQPGLGEGNLPLPDVNGLQEQLRQWHVDAETQVIVYGPSPALAARAWWVLRWAGLQHVQVLDGGIRSWVNHGGAVAQGDSFAASRVPYRALSLRPGGLPQIEVESVEHLPADVLLIDARDESSFIAGSIPGSCNLPASELWTPSTSLRTVQEVRTHFERIGALQAREVVAYCGGGVLSALAVLALSAFGVTPRLFVGSWSQWNKSAARMARSATARVSA